MGCHCGSGYCYGGCGYARGYADGLLQGQREYDALNGPDRTMYQMIGGPKHGERIETGGVNHLYVPIFPAPCYHYADMCHGLTTSRCSHSCCQSYIKSGTYEKTKTSKGVTVYRWKG